MYRFIYPSKDAYIYELNTNNEKNFGGDDNLTLDRTPNRVAMNDLLNFDAWIMGEAGAGSEVAKNHYWKGLLNDFDEDLGAAVRAKFA